MEKAPPSQPTQNQVHAVWWTLSRPRRGPSASLPNEFLAALATYWHWVRVETRGKTTLVTVGPDPIAARVIFEKGSWQKGQLHRGRCTMCTLHPCVHLLAAALHCPTSLADDNESGLPPPRRQHDTGRLSEELAVNLRFPGQAAPGTAVTIEVGHVHRTRREVISFKRLAIGAESIRDGAERSVEPAMKRLLSINQTRAVVQQECRKKTASMALRRLSDRLANDALHEVLHIERVFYDGARINTVSEPFRPPLFTYFDARCGLVAYFDVQVVAQHDSAPGYIVTGDQGLICLAQDAQALWGMGV
ncbi:MAG: hypothetical protein VX589_19515, partial [Myxococcota bacterium]|nr:hypothetical protein [Myxococcota bacterium]